MGDQKRSSAVSRPEKAAHTAALANTTVAVANATMRQCFLDTLSVGASFSGSVYSTATPGCGQLNAGT